MMKKSIAAFLFVVLIAIPAMAAAEPVASTALQQTPASQSAIGPRLIVSAFKVDPEPVEPGINFILTLDILNASAQNVDNLLVSVGSIDLAGAGSQNKTGGAPSFATRATGNSRFIGALDAGATTKVSFELEAAPRADPGLYVARININYTNASNEYTSGQEVGVSVSRPGRFEFQKVSVPPKVVVDRKFPISFEAVNAGGFKVQGVSLKLDSPDLTIEDGTKVIGVLESGDSDTLQAKATATKVGQVTAFLLIKYFDDFNRERVATQTVNIVVTSRQANAKLQSKPLKSSFLRSLGRFLKALLWFD